MKSCKHFKYSLWLKMADRNCAFDDWYLRKHFKEVSKSEQNMTVTCKLCQRLWKIISILCSSTSNLKKHLEVTEWHCAYPTCHHHHHHRQLAQPKSIAIFMLHHPSPGRPRAQWSAEWEPMLSGLRHCLSFWQYKSTIRSRLKPDR